jgi:hypothetical protein
MGFAVRRAVICFSLRTIHEQFGCEKARAIPLESVQQWCRRLASSPSLPPADGFGQRLDLVQLPPLGGAAGGEMADPVMAPAIGGTRQGRRAAADDRIGAIEDKRTASVVVSLFRLVFARFCRAHALPPCQSRILRYIIVKAMSMSQLPWR